MVRTFLRSILSAALLLTGGCAAYSNGSFIGTIGGGLYSHTIEPLTFNKDPTEVRESMKRATGSIMQVSDPLSSALGVRMGDNGLGEVAKKHGIETVYYADIERWRVLFGLWSRDVVHLYGR